MTNLQKPDLSKDSVKTPLTAEAVADCEDFVRFHLGERGRAFQETLLEALAMAEAVTAAGLTPDRFNAIGSGMSSDAHLRARIALADAEIAA